MRIVRGKFKAETKDYLIKNNLLRRKRLSKFKRINSFNKRNSIVKKMGFIDYNDYLKSSLWKEIRTNIVLNKEKCLFCLSNSELNVHHLFYSKENLTGKTKRGLILICQTCHEKISKDAIDKNIIDLFSTLSYCKKYYPGIDLRPYYKNGFFKETD